MHTEMEMSRDIDTNGLYERRCRIQGRHHFILALGARPAAPPALQNALISSSLSRASCIQANTTDLVGQLGELGVMCEGVVAVCCCVMEPSKAGTVCGGRSVVCGLCGWGLVRGA